MISVLVVEDSRVEREVLLHVLESDPGVRVVGTASDGAEAVEMVARFRPDVVTMDLVMPRMNGIDATRRIMETTPVPVVVVSGNWGCEEVARASEAFAAGALAGVRKPRGPEASDYEELRGDLLRTLRQMAGVKVVRRWRRTRGGDASPALPLERPRDGLKVVAVGVSTGGPPALEAMLRRLPETFPLPILIVQHIAEGFVDGLTEWLRRASRLGVQLAENRCLPRGGQVYLAPDGVHMGIDSSGRIVLERSAPEHSQRPSASYLFRSVAAACGGRAVGALLTGMGRDGARELRELRDLGAVTVAQNAESCVVFGMPAEAIRLGAARHVLPPEGIGDLLCALTGVPRVVDRGVSDE
jgi:two-component system chemotaxis response regulator CheB